MDDEEIQFMIRERAYMTRQRSIELRRKELDLEARERRLGQRERAIDRRQRFLDSQLDEIKRTGTIAQPTGESQLCSLSNEVIAHIVSYLDPPDLCDLALTCRQLYHHASPALFHSVRINDQSALQVFGRNCVGDAPLARGVKELFLSMRFIEGAEAQVQKDVNLVSHLRNLKKLTLEYRASEEMQNSLDWDALKLPLPSLLAASLTECTITFSEWARWSLHFARPLFNHPNIRKLSLRWAGTAFPHGRSTLKKGKGTTALEELTLIDPNLSPACLSQVLSYPRALKRLAMHPSIFENAIYAEEEINCGEFFDEIAKTAATSLECLRMDMQAFGSVIVPAPGMHKLRALRYLEISQCHINMIDPDTIDLYTVPEIDCPLEKLLPPNLEVLKISPATTEFPEIFEILKRKSELVPNLRRLIITAQHRDKAGQLALARREKERCAEVQVEMTMKRLLSRFPLTRKSRFSKLQKACTEAGVELRILYEDCARRDVFDEGAGPPVWEIFEQSN